MSIVAETVTGVDEPFDAFEPDFVEQPAEPSVEELEAIEAEGIEAQVAAEWSGGELAVIADLLAGDGDRDEYEWFPTTSPVRPTPVARRRGPRSRFFRCETSAQVAA